MVFYKWCFTSYLSTTHLCVVTTADSVNIKILNAGAWSRSSEKVFVSLPTELEDLIPEVEEFYKKNHSGRKLHWHHLMSNGIVSGSFRPLYNDMLYFLWKCEKHKTSLFPWDWFAVGLLCTLTIKKPGIWSYIWTVLLGHSVGMSDTFKKLPQLKFRNFNVSFSTKYW